MTIKMKAISMAMVLCGLSLSAHGVAGEPLDKVNALVEQKATEIDQKYAVLLDISERNELKIDLIVKQLAADAANNGKSVKEVADSAIDAFEITDPTAQRQLLIKLDGHIANSTGAGGPEPDWP